MARVSLPEIDLPQVRVPEVRLRDVRLPDVHLPDLHLPDLHLADRLADLRLPELRLPDLELTSEAPFVRQRKRSNPIWVAVKFVLGLGLGFLVGCMIAALLAPSAGEDTRQALRDRVPGGTPKLPDERAANSGAVTRGMSVATAEPVSIGGRIEAAKAAMATERREHENALFARFRRAIVTGRASEV
jgi:hypothetical protein